VKNSAVATPAATQTQRSAARDDVQGVPICDGMGGLSAARVAV
jgi:hypothetical protein